MNLPSMRVLALSASVLLGGCDFSFEDDEQSNGGSGQIYSALINITNTPNDSCLNGGLALEFGVDVNADGILSSQEVHEGRNHSICHGPENSNALAITSEASQQFCDFGGKTLLAGLDENQNSQLDGSEVTYTENICNVFSAAIRSLVTTQTEAPGLNCIAGGIAIITGQDLNNNGQLNTDEISNTQYVCNGATDGQLVDLSTLQIETLQELPGENCLHGGDRHNVGIDANTDGVLDEEEITNHSFTCNPNTAPVIHFPNLTTAIAGAPYSVLISSEDVNLDPVTLTITQMPQWLSQVQVSASAIRLEGTAPQTAGTVYSIQVVASDSELESTEELVLSVQEGTLLHIPTVYKAEGNSAETPAEIKVLLSSPLNNPLQVRYTLNSPYGGNNNDWQSPNYSGILIFNAGETQKNIPVSIFGDETIELDESISVSLYHDEYTGTETLVSRDTGQLIIENDDQLTLLAGQLNQYSFSDSGSNFVDITQAPDWLSWSTFIDYYYNALSLSATPDETLVGESGSFEIRAYSNGRLNNQTIQYSVIEGDRDLDGIANSLDVFPDNNLGHSDSDGDGLADEWEMELFTNLTTAHATSDFDSNGQSDILAFENHTPPADLSFSFEDGKLPNGWVNSGDVDWVVSQDNSYHGDYALSLARAATTGEEARLTFTIDAQVGTWRFNSRYGSANSSNFSPKILIDGVNSNIYTSDSSWREGALTMPAGRHTITLLFNNSYNSSNNEKSPIFYLDNFNSLLGITPGDRDGDGVKNGEDLFPDHSYGATDSDNDGLGDEWEKKYYSSNLNRFYTDGDYDQDGLTDLEEFTLGTRPSDRDTDNDNRNDGQDLYPTDKRYWSDTDNDNLPDQWELTYFASLTDSDGSQDSDGDGASDVDEFNQQSTPAPDSDGDGVVDGKDLFPNMKGYSIDNDNDGLADEWENEYYQTYYFSANGDYDQDGHSDLQEFLEGTNPRVINANAVMDFIVLKKGQSISFSPAINDISGSSILTVSEIDTPSNGTLVNNNNGSYTFTAPSDFIGWQKLNYVVNDTDSADQGDVYIHVQNDDPAKVSQIEISQGGNYAMALFDNGQVYAWGNNNRGQLGHYDNNGQAQYLPIHISGIDSVVKLAASDYASLALTSTGDVWYMGNRQSGPQKIVGTGVIKDITTMGNNLYFLKDDGSLIYAYGYSKPSGFTAISGLSDITAISASSNHLLALDSTKSVWAFGSNSRGQIGNGTTITVANTAAVKVSKISNIVSIEAAGSQSFAIDSNGKLYAWGYNSYGLLGDGTNTNRNVPVVVNTSEVVSKVSAGSSHTLFLTTSGKLFGMGRNYDKVLRNSSDSSFYTPILVSNRVITEMEAGSSSNLMATVDGDSLGVGRNYNGLLGDGTNTSRQIPSQVKWNFEGALSTQTKEGFEWGEIPPYWLNNGHWQLEDSNASSGSYAVSVDDELNDNESATLIAEFTTGAGNISFDYKTNSEVYDFLTFYIDGVEQASYSGTNPWTTSDNFAVDAGLHKLEWHYIKDGGTSEGLDTVWLDNINIPLDSDQDGVIDINDATPFVTDQN